MQIITQLLKCLVKRMLISAKALIHGNRMAYFYIIVELSSVVARMMLLALLLKNYMVKPKWLSYGIMGLQNGILNNINIFGGDNASMILTFRNLPFFGVEFRVKVCYGSHGSLSDASHWIYFMRANFFNSLNQKWLNTHPVD